MRTTSLGDSNLCDGRIARISLSRSSLAPSICWQNVDLRSRQTEEQWVTRKEAVSCGQRESDLRVQPFCSARRPRRDFVAYLVHAKFPRIVMTKNPMAFLVT